MKIVEWLITLGIGLASGTLLAEDATRQAASKKFSDTGCVLAIEDDAVSFGNSLGKIRWVKEEGHWRGRFYSRCAEQWVEVAEDAGYGLLFPDSGGNGGIHLSAPGDTELVHVPASVLPAIVEQSADRIEIRWDFDFRDSKQRPWHVSNRYVIEKGNRFIDESVTFEGPPVAEDSDVQCRLQRTWDRRGLDDDFFTRTVNAVSHKGYTVAEGAGFMVAITQPYGVSNSAGGGGMVHREFGWHFSAEKPAREDAVFRIMHRVPHRVERQGWLSLSQSPRYTLAHRLIFWDGPLQQRRAIDYLHQVAGPTRLPLRFSWKTFMDISVEGRKHELPGEFEDHGSWGRHISEGWYGYTDNCNWAGKAKGAGPFLLPGRPTLDWGGTWDLWTALGMYRYGEKYGDPWSKQRAVKIFNSIKPMKFQVDDPGFWADGAIWMIAPLTQQKYEGRKKIPYSTFNGWYHSMSPVHKHPKYGFLQSVDSADCWDLWVCDSGKSGYWLCEISRWLDRPDLLQMGRKAGDFLLSIQLPDGTLRGGRIHISGKPVYPMNLANAGAAVAVWSKLYEITKEEKYKTAATKLTDYAIEHFLDGTHWVCKGGEWDGMFDHDVTAASYAAWGFSALYLATGYEPAQTAAKRACNWIVANQSISNTNIKQFAPSKATFLGRDARTAGGIYQGQKPGAGYSQIQEVRPELPWACWLTYKATGDKFYRDAAVAYLVWQQYLTHTDKSDWRFYGMVSEGLECTIDWMNGFGMTYTAGSFGNNVTLFEMIEDGVIREL